MTMKNPDSWSPSPWIGPMAEAQFALWNAGTAWATLTNWFPEVPPKRGEEDSRHESPPVTDETRQSASKA